MATNTTSKIGKKIIAERVRELRRYGAPVSAADGYDLRRINEWTPQRFAAVTRMESRLFDFFDTFPITGFERVYPRNKKKIKAIRENFYGEGKRPSWLKGELIPKFTEGKTDYKINKAGDIIFKDELGKRIIFTMRPDLLAQNPRDYIHYVYDHLRDLGARVFFLKAGNHFFRPGVYNSGAFISPGHGAELVEEMQERYDNTQDWLHVVEGYYVDDARVDDIDAGHLVLRRITKFDREVREPLRRKAKSDYRRYRRWEKKGKIKFKNPK